MLFKPADDKSKRLRLLEELRRSDLLDARQKDWLDEELKRVKRTRWPWADAPRPTDP